VTFTSTLFRYPGKGGWTFAPVPPAHVLPITHGWGRTPVVATVDGHTFEGSVWREKSGRTLLAVPKAARGTKGHGDVVTVTLRLRVTIRQAGPKDTSAIVSLLQEAAAWLTARGSVMWRDDELRERHIDEAVRQGQFFVAILDDAVVGTVKFQLEDERFWPDLPTGEAAYIHRLAVRRECARGLVAPVLLEWAASEARTRGRRYLRLDCEASRHRLRSVYETAGFTLHSERDVGPYLVARYEMRLGA
jgi:GNAT superfamily N-acetyltransferase